MIPLVAALALHIPAADLPPKEFANLVAEFRRLEDGRYARLGAAKGTPQEQVVGDAIRADLREYSDRLATAAITLAKRDLHVTRSVWPLAWVIRSAPYSSHAGEAARLLAEHHPAHPATTLAARWEPYVGFHWSPDLLRTAFDNEPRTDRKADLLLVMARCVHARSEVWGFYQSSDPVWQKINRFRYGDADLARLKAESPKLEADAVKLFAKLRDEYGAEKSKSRTMKEIAEGNLFEIEHLKVGEVAPDIVGTDLDGKPMKLSDYRGKVVVLDFWASWCGPCLRANAVLKPVADGFKGRPFAIVGVNGDDDLAAVRKASQCRSFADGEKNGPISSRWNVWLWPTLYVIDHTGTIRARNPAAESVGEIVAPLVEAAEKR